MGIAEHSDRAGVDDALDGEIAGGLENVARPVNVHLLGKAMVVIADFVPSGNMEHAIDAFHGAAQRRRISDVADVQFNAQRLEQRGFLWRSHERGHLVTTPDQLLHELAAEKSGGPRDEIPRHG